MREARRQLAASPVLIGAVTVLIAIVAVFISYNANQGLPFVPTYKLNVELPNGAKLVPGNEVRAGGFRVGVGGRDHAASAAPWTARSARSPGSTLKLDKEIEPLSVDTRIGVRPRSALGLKYVELIPGRARAHVRDGRHGAAAQRDRRSRPSSRTCCRPSSPRRARTPSRRWWASATRFAGRGPEINTTIRELRPFLVHLKPVMRNLSDPRQRAAQPGPGARRHGGAGGAGGRGAGTAVR